MDNKNDYKIEKKKFKLTPLTPVHIGSGRNVEPLEYVIINGVLYLLDIESLIKREVFQSVIFKEKDNYVAIRNNLLKVCNVLDEKGVLDKFTIFKVKVDPTVQKKYEDSLSRMDSKLEISLLPRNPASYLPGSSIKGAIRTGVLNEIDSESGKGKGKICNDMRTNHDTTKLDPIAVEHCLLGARENDKNEFALSMFQYFSVSDVVVEGKTKVILINRPSFNKGRRGIPSYREVFCDGEGTVEITFASSRFQRIRKERHKDGPEVSGIDNFLYRADSFYRRKLEDEIARVEKAKKLEGKQDIISSLIEIEKKREEAGEDAYLLRIGFGSGYDCVTLKEYRHWKNPKPGKPGKGWGYSMNLTETGRPLGWVMLEEVN